MQIFKNIYEILFSFYLYYDKICELRIRFNPTENIQVYSSSEEEFYLVDTLKVARLSPANMSDLDVFSYTGLDSGTGTLKIPSIINFTQCLPR